jgi:hypothetical protein
MPRRVSEPFDDVTVYLVLNDHGQFGIAYDETDPARADRETVIRNFLSGQYSNALHVVAFKRPRDGHATCPRTSRARCWNEPSTPTTIWEKIPSGSSTGT